MNNPENIRKFLANIIAKMGLNLRGCSKSRKQLLDVYSMLLKMTEIDGRFYYDNPNDSL